MDVPQILQTKMTRFGEWYTRRLRDTSGQGGDITSALSH